MPAYTRSAACPWAPTPAEHEALAGALEQSWGQGLSVDLLAPSLAGDVEFRRFWARLERHSVSPGGAVELYRLNSAIDITAVLPTIRVPTLVLHRTGDRMVPIDAGRYTADHIPGASFVELAGDDHLTFVGDADAFVGEVEEFLTGTREPPDADRVLATVLFTDIVRSTEEIVARGDRAWRDLLEAHHRLVRRELRRFRGQEIDTAGDGFLATFDGPARAIRCAQAIVDTLRGVGLRIRAGLHTGEVEMRNGGTSGIGGIAVHIGARVAALAGPSEILVSRTVRDLTAGAGIIFSPRGSHQLKGVPDEWELYAVDSTGSPDAV